MFNIKKMVQANQITTTTKMVPIKYLVNEADIIDTISYYSKKYGKNIILHGGQLATTKFYGFKNMRTLTNDIDFILNKEIVTDFIKNEELFFQPDYQVLFSYKNDIISVFSCNHIHKLTLDQDFFNSIEAYNIDQTCIYVCSREYLICFKLRRGVFNNGKYFGKDIIDILNIITAPSQRFDLNEIDYLNAALITKKYAKEISLEKVFKELSAHCHNIPFKIRDTTKLEISKMKNIFYRVFK